VKPSNLKIPAKKYETAKKNLVGFPGFFINHGPKLKKPYRYFLGGGGLIAQENTNRFKFIIHKCMPLFNSGWR